MLDAATLSRIEQIAADRASGAAELGLRATELLLDIRPEELPEAAGAIVRAQPAMAAVHNAAQAALEGRLLDFLERLRNSAGIIAEKIAQHLHSKTVLTHSFSSTVMRALQLSFPARVICTESLPGSEGRRMAALLNAEVIPDSGIYSAMSSVDLVVVGADAVSPDFVVNKVGTALVALAARELTVPAFVLCGSEKMVPAGWHPSLSELFERTPRSWFTGVIDDSQPSPGA